MRAESEVWQALLRRKGLSVTDLAEQLGVTRQHAHRLLTGRRPAESQRKELEHALALGTPTAGNPLLSSSSPTANSGFPAVGVPRASACSSSFRWDSACLRPVNSRWAC